jgi:Family of unknown function (DUF5996)
MQHPIPDLGEWPSLEWEQWKDTAETLHMYMQIVGKTRLALTPLQNHWWNIPLYLTARGLSTSAMPADGGRLLDIEFDFVSHELVCRTSDGEIRKIPLRPVPVAEFFEEFTRTLSSLGVSVKIHPMPVEVANPIRCDLEHMAVLWRPTSLNSGMLCEVILDSPPHGEWSDHWCPIRLRGCPIRLRALA